MSRVVPGMDFGSEESMETKLINNTNNNSGAQTSTEKPDLDMGIGLDIGCRRVGFID